MPKGKRWFKLDNAAKLYPAVANWRWSSIFRVSVEMNEPVMPDALQRALDMTLPRFPTFKVGMRSGLFWYYLEEIQVPLRIRQDAGHPCMPLVKRANNGYLMRVFYYRNRISAEFFHSLTDGTGGLCFIKTLAVAYLRVLGHDVQFDQGALPLNETPSPDETRDAFMQMPLPRVRVSRWESSAYHLPGTLEIPHTLRVIAASLPADEMLRLAKEAQVSLTEYLTAVMLYTAYCEQQKNGGRKSRMPLRVSVPVNMRAYYATKTLRNFSSFVNPDIDPRLGAYSFEEIARDVHHFMRYFLNPKFLCATIATNVADERNPLIRITPLFLKRLVIGLMFRRAGDRLVTSTISNIGRTQRPTGSEALIRRFEFQLGAPSWPMWNCAAVTTGNDLRIVFSGNIRETTLPREMLRFLMARGVRATVESNMEDN